MNRQKKSQLLAIIDTFFEVMQEARQICLRKQHLELNNLLADLQEGIVQVGNIIEYELGIDKSEKIVRQFEKICELLWKCTQAEKTGKQIQVLNQIKQELQFVQKNIKRIQPKGVVVFFPYKASMWDCMESVWQAAKNDETCETYVVPIPYFDLKNGEVIERHYEGEKFPLDVPITDYQEFSLEEYQPDIAFIHNPFDKYNYVTSVLPEYYSDNLKKYVKKLVYIPYFITGEAVYVTHRELPSYYFVDFIVTQCEKTIESYAETIPKNKFLPFGSPIADRILQMQRNKPEIPGEWKAMLVNGRDFGEKRTVMLNTSISLLMQQKERFLDKLEYIFEMAKQMQGILLIWRPHPLLKISAKTLGENIVNRLQQLEDMFWQEKIGILDKTADVGVTVALSDAYLGEINSSLIHMFGIAGKPRFFINVTIPQKKEDIIKTEYAFSGYCTDKEKEYFILEDYGWIVERNRKNGDMKPLVYIPGSDIISGIAYSSMELKEEKLIVYPQNANGIFIYHLKTGEKRKYFPPKKDLQKEVIDVKELDTIEVTTECIASIIAEKFKKGNVEHVWRESEENTLEDYFHFLHKAKDDEMTGYVGKYQNVLANLDGTCGMKVYQAVRNSLKIM